MDFNQDDMWAIYPSNVVGRVTEWVSDNCVNKAIK